MVNAAAPSPLSLLQRFLILQQTRAAISNELTGAFNEQGISDAALNKVVEISSIGLLEVRQEVQEIIDNLARSQDVLAERSAMKSIEELEKKRITELTRAHQLRRIRSLLGSGEKDDGNDDDDVAIQARKIEITEQITQAERSITTLTQDIAEHIDTIRETVADMS